MLKIPEVNQQLTRGKASTVLPQLKMRIQLKARPLMGHGVILTHEFQGLFRHFPGSIPSDLRTQHGKMMGVKRI